MASRESFLKVLAPIGKFALRFGLPFFVVVFLFLFFFYGSSAESPKDLVSQWTNTLESLSLRPVYPMREDVEVGDIYLMVNKKFSGESTYRPKRIGRMPMLTAEKRYYATRQTLSADRLKFDIPQTFDEKEPQKGEFLLREAALPGIKVASKHVLKASGRNRLFGLFSAQEGDDATVDLTISSIREISAPEENYMVTSLTNFCLSNDGHYVFDKERLKFFISQYLDPNVPKDVETASPTIFVVTSVLYAGSIDLSLHDSREVAAAQQPNQLPGNGKQAADIRAVGASIGIRGSLTSEELGGALLHEAFDRPLAFAVDGLSIRVLGPGALSGCEIDKSTANAGLSGFLSGKDTISPTDSK